MLSDAQGKRDLSLKKKDFQIFEFLIYRGFRLLLLPLGKELSVKVAVRLHWIFRHLAIAVSSNNYGNDFLNSRSAIIQGKFIELYAKEGNIIVDLACGAGRYWPTISQIKGVAYLGIDASTLHISSNQRNFPGAQFKLGNVLNSSEIPRCEIIIASHIIEHLDDPKTFLMQLKSLCNLLIIEVPDFYSDPINIVSFNLRAPWWSDSDHRREYSTLSLESILLESGYTILNLKQAGGTIAVVASPFFEI
jgi:SAM-dependent methyltransferase